MLETRMFVSDLLNVSVTGSENRPKGEYYAPFCCLTFEDPKAGAVKLFTETADQMRVYLELALLQLNNYKAETETFKQLNDIAPH